MHILVTGCAGFIGLYLSFKLLKSNKKIKIIGIDNINSYYSKKLKIDRIKIVKKNPIFIFFKFNISNKKKLRDVLNNYRINYVIHLASQVGVRYSLPIKRSMWSLI